MITFSATFDLMILYLVAADIVAILGYVLVLKHRARRIQRSVALVTATVLEYFRDNGGAVGVECISRAKGRRFIALVSSVPSKRFRHSNVIEVILRDHVRKVCGLELEKVYWCFPIREKQPSPQRDSGSSDAPAAADAGDAYRAEGLSRLRKVPGYQVTEASIEAFETTVARQGLVRSGEPALT